MLKKTIFYSNVKYKGDRQTMKCQFLLEDGEPEKRQYYFFRIKIYYQIFLVLN